VKGEWWRILTAVFFQDGWLVGGLMNIVLLLAIGSLCEQVWSRSDWLMISIAGALIGELLGLRWEPAGAGNSIGTCALAGSLIALRPFRNRSALSRLMRSLAAAICLLLVALGDIHGAAALTGWLVGLTRSVR
jgi:rhomboid protease GluP